MLTEDGLKEEISKKTKQVEELEKDIINKVRENTAKAEEYIR